MLAVCLYLTLLLPDLIKERCNFLATMNEILHFHQSLHWQINDLFSTIIAWQFYICNVSVLTFGSVDEILCSNHLYETSVCLLAYSEELDHFLFTTIWSVRTPTFETVDKNLWYDNSNETAFAVLSHGAISFSDYSHFAKLTLELFLGVKRLTVVEVWHLLEVRLYFYLKVSPAALKSWETESYDF